MAHATAFDIRTTDDAGSQMDDEMLLCSFARVLARLDESAEP